VLLEHIFGKHLSQVLMTFGIVIIVADAVEWIWGGVPRVIPPPDLLKGALSIGDITVPRYRLFLIVLGLLTAFVLWLAQEKSSIGISVRAAHDDADMLRTTGVNVSRLWTLTYAVGAGLAGAAGVLAGPLLALGPGLDLQILLLAFVVLIMGGLGTLTGALVGSLVVGLIYTFGTALIPSVSLFVIFVPMAAILLLRPKGLVVR
jgi:branched-chain amino acid transport system permease protein